MLQKPAKVSGRHCHSSSGFSLSQFVLFLHVIPDRLMMIRSDQISVWCTDSLCKQKSHWIITINGKMNVWTCKLIFPTDTLQQNIEKTDLKPFLAGDNTSVLIILATKKGTDSLESFIQELDYTYAVVDSLKGTY